MKRVIIVSGGDPPSSGLFKGLNQQDSLLIGADRGAEFFFKEQVMPDFLVGDFDSIDQETLAYFKGKTIIETYEVEKDFTDTEAAFLKALALDPEEIYLLGCTGNRLDHVFGTLSLLERGEKKGISCYLMDDYNKISVMLSSGKLLKTYGKYVSFQSLGGPVEGFSLEGVRYPITGYTLKLGDPRTVSNEFKDEMIEVSFKKGIVLVFQTKD